MKSRSSSSSRRGRSRDAAAHLLLRTVFWVLVATGLYIYFKLTQ